MSLFNLNSFYIIYIVIVFGDMRVTGDKHTTYFFGFFKKSELILVLVVASSSLY